mgnify:FL=1
MNKLKNILIIYGKLTIFCMLIGTVFLIPACFSENKIKHHQSTAQSPLFILNTGSKDPCLRLSLGQNQQDIDLSGLTAQGSICHFFPQKQNVQIKSITFIEGMWFARILAIDAQDLTMKKPLVIQISPTQQRLYALKIYGYFVVFLPFFLMFIAAIYRAVRK